MRFMTAIEKFGQTVAIIVMWPVVIIGLMVGFSVGLWIFVKIADKVFATLNGSF